MTRTAFSALLALALLGLYLYGVGEMLWELVRPCKDCTPRTEAQTAALRIPQTVLTTIGALISAVVVSALAVTPPGKPILSRQMTALGDGEKKWLDFAINAYLVGWLLAGGSAFLVGTILKPGANTFITDLGQAWLGAAVVAAYAFFKLVPPAGAETRTGNDGRSPASETDDSELVKKLKKKIEDKKIIFDTGSATRLKSELLNQNTGGTQVTAALQTLILKLCDKTTKTLRISDLIRDERSFHSYDNLTSRHAEGKAVDLGNEDIANDLLPNIATKAEVKRLGIDEIIFDATVAGQTDANKWNFNGGVAHKYDDATLKKHKDHIHIAVS